MSNTVITSPERFLTFEGDVRHMTDTGNGVGEVVTAFEGEPWEAVTADYDPETNKTRVGFASALLTDRARRIQHEKKETHA